MPRRRADHPGPVYSAAFYEEAGDRAQHAAIEVVPILMELLAPESVIDVGCGVGAFIHEFSRHGVTDALGVEGLDFPPDRYRGPEDSLTIMDIEQPVEMDRRFDLAVCLEVAEHLPSERSAGFVGDLTRLADVVVFSAAIPGQGGTHHVNEQWPPFWRDQFARHGFEAYDVLRPIIWDNPSIAWWYRQNVVLYARPGVAPDGHRPAAALQSLVHPELYDAVTARAQTVTEERDRLAIDVGCLRSLIAAATLLASCGSAGSASERASFPTKLLRRRWSGNRGSREPAPVAEPFDAAWYLLVNPDVAAANVEPRHHYATAGWREGRDPHPLFDTDFYLNAYPDVARSDLDPLAHFDQLGWREGRDPHPLFDTDWYLATNPDVADAGVNPLSHFVIHGVFEGRPPRAHPQ